MAAQLPGADHFNPGGRRALFAGRYRLAWGSKQVEADAFLTGLVIVSPDLRSLDVGIMGFGRDSKRLEEVVRFTASTDVPALIDVGESFQTRGFFDGGRVRSCATRRSSPQCGLRRPSRPTRFRTPRARSA